MLTDSGIIEGYEVLTREAAKRAYRANKENGWGISAEQLARLNREHRKARERSDKMTMELIEYRLEDINFHNECSLLHEGKYGEVDSIVRRWKKEIRD